MTPPSIAVAPAALPLLVIKLDDLTPLRGETPPAWRRVDDVLAQRRIKAGYGVICAPMATASPAYVDWIKTRHAAGRVEFWLHGWTHKSHLVNGAPRNEFDGWDDAGGKALVARAQAVARAQLGFAFRAFGPTGCGAPGALLDAAALRALHDDPDLRVVLYHQPLDAMARAAAADGKLTLLEHVADINLESRLGVPDLRRLMAGLAAHPTRRYCVLEGHPARWNDARFAEFLRMLDFLTAQKAVFATPSECAAFLRQA
jgi:hypothetical protein